MDYAGRLCAVGALAAGVALGTALATPATSQADSGASTSTRADDAASASGTSRAAAAPPRKQGSARRAPLAQTGGGARTPGQAATPAFARREGSFIDNLKTFVDTYVDPPWIGIAAGALNSIVNNPPDVTSRQVEVNLGKGVSSNAIPFATGTNVGRSVVYSVPDHGSPGAASHGTVAVDNTTGTFTYTPDVTFTGTDTFSFVAQDTTHIRIVDDLIGTVLNFLGLQGAYRDTETVTVFNGVPIQPNPEVAAYTDITGDFAMLTYNVAGSPGLGGLLSHIPNMLTIGSRINAFDIVNVQDDVGYHEFLAANAVFADQSSPEVPAVLGVLGLPFSDGLNTFSAYGIDGLQRLNWGGCTVLCVGSAGFTYSRLAIQGGQSIDLYNIETQGAQLSNADIAELSDYIQKNSIGRPVIVTGDFNQLYSDPGQTLSQFATANGLTDAWAQLEYDGIAPVDAPTCSYEDSCEQTDKIFYRSAAPLNLDDPASSPVQLFAQTYTNEGLNFRNGSGQDLASSTPQSVTFGYRVSAIGPANVDPENWMADLPGISKLPFTQLPIPGTHDSGSFSITDESQWALTGEDQFGFLVGLPPLIEDLIVKPIAAAWARTQSQSLTEQFADGIRYVDLRFSNEPDGQIYIEHGLRGATSEVVIDQIAEFAQAHPKEVLFVYVQGLNNFDSASNAALVAQMQDAFGSRMAPRSLGTSASLEDLWAIDKNVILIYDDAGTVSGNPNLWYDNTLYRPWWDVQTMDALYTANQTNLRNRPPGSIWGLFGETTPDTNNVVMGILGLGPFTVEQFITRGQPTLQQWLRSDFKTNINLVTEDWYQKVGATQASYMREVLAAVYETMGSR